MPALPLRPLGDSGLQVSVVGLGCNNFGRRLDVAGTRRVVDASLEHGVTFFDTADIYGQARVRASSGRCSPAAATRSSSPRSSAWTWATGAGRVDRVTTSSRPWTRRCGRLRTDVIDYYWYHRPDGVTPIAETLGALDELVTEGKVRAIGASNFSAAELDEADAVAREHGLTRFTAVQNEYSLLVRDAERDVLPACERLGLGFVPFFPLALGLLTGKYRRGEPGPSGARLSEREEIASAQQFAQVESLQAYAQERGLTLVDVAIGALLARQVVSSVIAGATKPEQIEANAAAAAWVPSRADQAELEQLLAA